MLIFVYGTLRVGQGNNRWFLADVECVQEGVSVAGYKMYTSGGIPAIHHTGDTRDSVVGDVFDLSTAPNPDLVLAALDQLEGEGEWYHRVEATTTTGLNVELYAMPMSEIERGFPHEIPEGNWIEWRKSA